MRTSRAPWIVVVAAAVAVLALAGCSGAESTTEAGSSSDPVSTSTSASAYPVTVRSSIGGTVLPAKPIRVATFDGADTDIAVAFGLRPVAHTTPDFSVAPWLKGKLNTSANVLSAQEINLERLAAAKPDVIVAGTWATGTPLARFKRIAPTVGSSLTDLGADQNATEPWRARVALFGQILNDPERARAITTETDDYLARQAAQIPDIAHQSFRFVAYGAGFGANFINGNPGIFTDLGFVATAANKERATLSEENLDTLDAEYLFIWTNTAGRKHLESNSRFAKLPAAKAGHVVWLNNAAAGASNNPSPSSTRYFVDAVMKQLKP